MRRNTETWTIVALAACAALVPLGSHRAYLLWGAAILGFFVVWAAVRTTAHHPAFRDQRQQGAVVGLNLANGAVLVSVAVVNAFRPGTILMWEEAKPHAWLGYVPAIVVLALKLLMVITFSLPYLQSNLLKSFAVTATLASSAAVFSQAAFMFGWSPGAYVCTVFTAVWLTAAWRYTRTRPVDRFKAFATSACPIAWVVLDIVGRGHHHAGQSWAIGNIMSAALMTAGSAHLSQRIAAPTTGLHAPVTTRWTTAIVAACLVPLVPFVGWLVSWEVGVMVAVAIIALLGRGFWLDRHALTGSSLRYSLRRAVRDGSITAAVQPLVGGQHGTPLGAVAWATWSHPRFGQLPAAEWWAEAVRGGLVAEVERCVLASLTEADFDMLIATLEDATPHVDALRALARQRLVIVRCAHGREAARAAGCRIAGEVGDLGDIDVLVVTAKPTDAAGTTAVAACKAAASSAGLATVALGVEDAGLLDRYLSLGIEMIAGYGVGRPVLCGSLQRGDERFDPA